MALEPQIYGLAMAQEKFGGPRGVWLECRRCDESQRIVGAKPEMSDKQAAAIFRRHGWTGRTDKMLNARCPRCSARKGAKP